MSYNEAFGAIVYGIMAVGFLWWYGWCVFTMIVRCQSPRAFFSAAYSTSSLFAAVNGLAVIAGAAWVLMTLTAH